MQRGAYPIPEKIYLYIFNIRLPHRRPFLSHYISVVATSDQPPPSFSINTTPHDHLNKMADSEPAPPALKTYRGNCHCGLFVYEAQLPEIKSVAECNCSLCYKKGYLWVFPGAGDFKVVKGSEDDLTTYTLGGAATTLHRFCPTCGTPVMAFRPGSPPGKQVGLNAHAIQDLNTWDLKIIPFDGRALPPAWEEPKYTGPEPPVSGDAPADKSKIYAGSCHCGAVTLAVRSIPLDNTYPQWVKVCSCSICERMGATWIYPKASQVIINGLENCTKYLFGRKIVAKAFCKTCGVCVCNMAADLSPEEYEALSDEYKGWVKTSSEFCVLNLRVLNGWDLGEIKDKIERFTGGAEVEPRYVNP
ncbi:centromere protein V [Rhypophila decipiens]